MGVKVSGAVCGLEDWAGRSMEDQVTGAGGNRGQVRMAGVVWGECRGSDRAEEGESEDLG